MSAKMTVAEFIEWKKNMSDEEFLTHQYNYWISKNESPATARNFAKSELLVRQGKAHYEDVGPDAEGRYL